MQQLKTYKEAFGYTAQVSDFDYGFSITYNCYLVILFTTSAMAPSPVTLQAVPKLSMAI